MSWRWQLFNNLFNGTHDTFVVSGRLMLRLIKCNVTKQASLDIQR
jgi:hypothetical protein